MITRLASCAALWVLSGTAFAGVQLEQVFTSETVFPNGDRFNGLTLGPVSTSGGQVAGFAFWPSNGGRQVAWRTGGGVPEVVASAGTGLPLGAIGFRGVELENDIVMFGGLEQGQSAAFPYIASNGVLTRLAATGDPLPGGTGTFHMPVGVALSDGQALVMDRSGVMYSGLYRSPVDGSGFVTIADRSSTAPGGVGTFTRFLQADLDHGTTAFMATDAESSSLYWDRAGSITRLLGHSFMAPEGEARLSYTDLDLAGDRVAFSAHRITGDGTVSAIYTLANGQIALLADSTMTAPEVGSGFGSFGPMALSGPDAAFHAVLDDGREGLFAMIGGELLKVVVEGDVLDDRVVRAVVFGSSGFNDGTIAFGVRWDGAEGIYTMSVPAPAAAPALLSLLALARRRRPNCQQRVIAGGA